MLTLRLCVLAALAAVAAGCGQPAHQMPVPRAPVVTVSTPIEQEVVDNLYSEGYTAAVSTVDIRARVSGYLSNVYFTDGEDVKKGQPLFLIDKRPYQATVDQAKAEMARTEAQLKRLTADFVRAEWLLPMKTISQEEFDRIAGERAQAAAEVEARKAALDSANLDLHFCAIASPIDGRISRKLVTEGNLVSANETLLTTIVSIEPIYAYFDVDEPTVLRIRQMIREGQMTDRKIIQPPVNLGLDIETGYPHPGVIDFVENRIDPNTGTLKVRAIFANKDQVLSPGLHARIEFPYGKPHKALLIAERAIGTSQGQKYVYLVDDKNQVVERPVKLGLLRDHLREVISGLEPGERVIVNGLQRVRPGVTVDAKPAPPAANPASTAAKTE